MASILRSSKFVRYIAGFARNIVVNTPREFDGNFVNTTQCLCGAIPRSFATQVAAANYEQNLDSVLRRLDQDVRRSGRISRRDLEDVLEEIRQTRSATSSQSLLIIRCCGNLVPEEMPETRTKLVQEIWNTFRNLNVPMDISHYNALLRVYLENEHEFSPTEFLTLLESKGIEPNRVTYQRLIAQYCQVGDIEGATRILEYMREKQLPVNENVFNALINGHSQTGDMDSARGILTVMSQAGLEPSADTYTTLICGYASKGELETMESLINECETKDIFLLDKDYLDIAYALVTNGHSQHLESVLGKTRKATGYTHDAINVILRLINLGFEDEGFLILKSMPRMNKADGTVASTGSFFLRQMARAGRPVEKIVAICDKMEQEDMFERALSFVTECCLQQQNDQLVFGLLNEMKSRGMPVRQHYFWPLIVSKASDDSGEEIVKILNEMAKYNINPNSETIREYVIPNLKGKSSDIIAKLRNANVSIGSAACSLVHSLLLKNDIVEAAIIVQSVNAYYYPEMIRKPLAAALYKTNDIQSCATILRYVYENLSKFSEVQTDESNVNIDRTEVIGKFLLELSNNGRQFINVAENILSALVVQGLSISTITAEKIEQKLNEKMTPAISSLLAQLSSGDLTPVPIERKDPIYTPSNQMNIPQLERLVQNLEAKKGDTIGLKRQLLTLYYRAKELEKMENVYKEMESLPEFQYTTGIYAQMLEVCAHHERYEDTVRYLTKLQEIDPNFILDEMKVIKVAIVMVKNGHYDDAVALISRPRDPKPEERNYNYNSTCWRLLNHIAELGKVDELQSIFDALQKNHFIEANNVNLGPLVKVHLVNKDLEKALEKFEWCCNTFRATPWKNELACQLINSEDADKLQKLTDMSTAVHGEINSLYDLVFAFVECGRVRQARKILETPGLQTRPHRINYACQRYQQEGMVKPLEGLRDATKDLNHIDRSDIYYQLLLSYIKQNDAEKALSLWTQMQDECLPPNDQFLSKLGAFLQKSNMKVPFVIPGQIKKAPVTPAAPVVPRVTSNSHNFRQLVKTGELDKALELKRTTTEPFATAEMSVLIEKLVQSERQDEATKLAVEILEKGGVPMTRVFRFLLNRLANAGDVQAIELIGSKLTSEVKKLVSFDNRICHANLVAGKADEYLTQLENEIDGAKDDELKLIGEKFPRGGAVGILERHVDLIDRYEKLAIKYAKRGIIAPVNVLWSHYFINNEDQKAEEVWKLYLHGAPRIMFQRVVQHSREVMDEQLAEKLIEHLKTSNVTEGALGNAYSCLLDVLVIKQKLDEAVTTFETAVKTVPIENINRTAVLRIKEVYEKNGKPFNHTVPPKINNKNQTSSSSSSDDEARKRSASRV